MVDGSKIVPGRPGAQQNLDYQYIYDQLDRLSEAKKGTGSGTGFTLAAGGQQWDLDVIGNWDSFDTDLNGDGLYQAANDRILAGGFNLVNEITQLTETKQGGTPTALSYTYDKAGNLRERAITSSTSYKYTHDAWNRLVKVEHVRVMSTTTRGEYEYNGLSQRCVKRSDHDVYDLSLGLDEQRVMYYSAAWQVLEEEVDDSWSSGHSTDRLVQNVWGMRYIDDLAIRRQDTDYSGTWGNSSSGDFTHYALSDHQFSVVALIDDSANLVERVSYSPYGEARHHWAADVDGDGDVDGTDRSLLNTSYNKQLHQTNDNVHADFNRDGVVDSNDSPLVSPTNYVAALSPGEISSSSVGNVIGYAGYVFNSESFLYTMRFRCYDPATGRWLERDPAGYVDSMSLYGYGWGSPVSGMDPFGLAWWNPWSWGDEDAEWEEMMHENQEMLKKKIDESVENGNMTEEEAEQFIWEMENELETVMLQLSLIEAEGKVAALTTARNIVISMIPVENIAFIAFLKFGRPVIIGAGGARVMAYAKNIKAIAYGAGTSKLFAAGTKVGIVIEKLGYTDEAIQGMYIFFNKWWIYWQKASYRRIIDIGRGNDEVRDAYKMEKRVTENYGRLEQCH